MSASAAERLRALGTRASAALRLRALLMSPKHGRTGQCPEASCDGARWSSDSRPRANVGRAMAPPPDRNVRRHRLRASMWFATCTATANGVPRGRGGTYGGGSAQIQRPTLGRAVRRLGRAVGRFGSRRAQPRPVAPRGEARRPPRRSARGRSARTLGADAGHRRSARVSRRGLVNKFRRGRHKCHSSGCSRPHRRCRWTCRRSRSRGIEWRCRRGLDRNFPRERHTSHSSDCSRRRPRCRWTCRRAG